MKLHIGGQQVKEGWKILNIQANPGVDYVGNISDLSQFPDRSIDTIYASHVFEHVPVSAVPQTLSGMFRVLKSGGKAMVSVPDMDVLCQSFINPAFDLQTRFTILRMMFGGQIDANDFHYFGWNFAVMRHFFDEAGFASFERVDSFGLFEDTSESRPFGFPISLNVVATK